MTEKHIFISLPLEDLQTVITDCVNSCLIHNKHESHNNTTTEPQDEFLTIQQAGEILKLSVPTIYSKVSKMELPGVMKRGKRLYFSRMELIEYLKQGRTKTRSEIAEDAETFLSNKKRAAK